MLLQPQCAHRLCVNTMGFLRDDEDVPHGRILTLYIWHVQQHCSSVHDIIRNQCRADTNCETLSDPILPLNPGESGTTDPPEWPRSDFLGQGRGKCRGEHSRSMSAAQPAPCTSSLRTASFL